MAPGIGPELVREMPASYMMADEDDLPITGANVRDGPALSSEGRIMAWIYLLSAGILEIVWAFAMKQSHGFTRIVPTVIMVIAMVGSVGLLTLSMRVLPLGTAYVIWTGIGAVGAFLVGVMVLGEAANPMRILAALLIVSGLVLMKISSSA